MKSIDLFTPKLKDFKKVVITTHAKPDADALGSSLALYLFLKNRNIHADVIIPTDYPDFLKWMNGTQSIIEYSKDTHQNISNIFSNCDLIFCLDFSSLKRIKELETFVSTSNAVKVLIDHHLEPDVFTDYALWDTNACSTTELVLDFINKMEANNEITPDIADCLYAGILTDTGSFKHPNTTSHTMRIVADLIDMGANPNKINHEIFNSNTHNKLKFLGYALLNCLEVNEDHNVAFFQINKDTFKKFNLQTGDTEGLVNYALSMKNINMGAIIMEKDDEIRLSFRCLKDYNVNLFARDHFNGGGHKNAAGGLSKTNFDETLTKFKSLIPQFNKNYNKNK